MFRKGDYIVYGSTGVCEVLDVTTMQMEGIPDDKLYYVLRPYQKKESEIFTPVDNKRTVKRNIISPLEAKELLESISSLEEFQIPIRKFREDSYKKCIRSCSCRDMLRLVITLHHKKQKRLEHGKNFPSTDERYLKIAEDNLVQELAFSLGAEENRIRRYIYEHISAKIPAHSC
ncbi:MAG TPA: CarD family transcriptional regulator [Candidatus Anaerostipes excrementavium]|uniref:CarD family transcriptional regulator n=1 Tax=Candidatus Anaerostipes excrementavium TaxID=2838463 RepID=A0A9D2B919_9FIRM|nr:CarD family transcriptional regulator [uncultured Anaerostipes sp.]HIX66689.1 CarD family transcriptional regulator [Candidatus Anaerostipes excrementavium]